MIPGGFLSDEHGAIEVYLAGNLLAANRARHGAGLAPPLDPSGMLRLTTGARFKDQDRPNRPLLVEQSLPQAREKFFSFYLRQAFRKCTAGALDGGYRLEKRSLTSLMRAPETVRAGPCRAYEEDRADLRLD